jgi:hypothetical protein
MADMDLSKVYEMLDEQLKEGRQMAIHRLTRRHGKHCIQIGGTWKRNHEPWEKLAEYEDLVEQGELVRVVHGEWIPEDVAYNGRTEKFKCSACGRVHFYGHYVHSLEYEFCPMCGAKMDGGDK